MSFDEWPCWTCTHREGVGTLWTLPEFGCKKWEREES